MILSLYSRGLSTREIKAHIAEIYGVEVSPALVSTVTDNIAELVREWQTRPLEAVYPIVYLDALRVKVRIDKVVQNRCFYLAIGVNLEGKKETLGLWSAENEGAKFWLTVLTELQNHGAKDIFIACVDGLKGFTESIEAVFPEIITQRVYRPPNQKFVDLYFLQRPEGSGRRLKADLYRPNRRRSVVCFSGTGGKVE